MMSNKVSRKLATLARRTLLASMLCSASPVVAEVIEIPTSPLERGATQVGKAPVIQVQTQLPAQNPGQVGQAIAPPVLAQPQPLQDAPPTLNVDPNADINDLIPPVAPVAPPPAPPRSPNVRSQRESGLGASRGSFSSAPTMIGDLFGGGLSTFGGSQTVTSAFGARGTILSPPSGGEGQASSLLVFETGNDLVPDDVFSIGNGLDLAGNDGFADTFQVAEPLPPSDAPTSPGAGFTFDGGTAVFVSNSGATTAQPGQYNNGSNWFLQYSYTQTLLNPDEGGRPIPTPGVSVRRIKLSENFSPEVRDRCFASYNFFNDAYGGLGDVSRYTLGAERILVDQLVSFEARMLMAGTYGSTQDLADRESRSFEIGNAAFIGKGVLLRNDGFLWSAGLGFTIPTADDTRIRRRGEDILVIKNRTVHLLPFTAVLLRASQDTYLQAFMQLDIAASGDPLYGNLAGGPLPKLGVFTDSTLMNLDLAVNHVLHRNRSGGMLRGVIANGELHYSGSLQESDFVTSNGLTYTNLQRYFNVVNATAGVHLLVGNNLVVTPAMSVPLRDGLDEQFDYEAIVQVNYLH